MPSKRVKILPSEEWVGGDLREIVFKYSIVDVDLVGKPEEEAQTALGKVVVGISQTLETLWGPQVKSVNGVLLGYARQLIEDKLYDGILTNYEEIQLSTYNAPDHPPFDPEMVQPSFDAKYQSPAALEDLTERAAPNQDLASEIIDLRDNINALFGERFGGRILTLPQERSLSELSRTCNSHEEFAYRVASLSGLATSIETNYKTRIQSSENKKSLNLLGEFLRHHFPARDTNQIMDTLQNLNRLRKMYPIHTDRAGGVMSSFAFFGLEYPIQDYQAAWLTLLEAYSEALHSLLDLVKSTDQQSSCA